MESNTKIMKKLLLFTQFYCFHFINAQVSVVVQQPELRILYRDFNNLIIPSAEGAEDNRISAVGAIITPTTYNGKKGFFVKPQTKTVSLIHEAKINGNWQRFDTVLYKVKKFPSPLILNESISKTTGAIIKVGYSEDVPITHNFEVLNLSLNVGEGVSINGSVIQPELLKKIKPGKMTGGTASVKNITTGSENQITFSLKITN